MYQDKNGFLSLRRGSSFGVFSYVCLGHPGEVKLALVQLIQPRHNHLKFRFKKKKFIGLMTKRVQNLNSRPKIYYKESKKVFELFYDPTWFIFKVSALRPILP